MNTAWEGTPLEDAARDFLNSPPHRMAYTMGAAEASARTIFAIDPDATEIPNEAKEAMLLFVNFHIFNVDATMFANEIERLLEQYRSRMRMN